MADLEVGDCTAETSLRALTGQLPYSGRIWESNFLFSSRLLTLLAEDMFWNGAICLFVLLEVIRLSCTPNLAQSSRVRCWQASTPNP